MRRVRPNLVAEARNEGYSWDAIATALGTNADQARRRFDPASSAADTRWMLNIDVQ